MLKSLFRKIFRQLAKLYPREHGKYSILTRLYFRHLAPKNQTEVIAKLRFGVRMQLNLLEYLQAHLFVFGSYELPTVKLIRSYLKPGDLVIDVGAQMGYLSLISATSAGGGVRVIAFEPEPENLKRLKVNIGLNGLSNIHIEEGALSNADGTVRLFLSLDNNAGTHSTLQLPDQVGEEFIDVPAAKLDTYEAANSLAGLSLIKIDVEGAEIEVLDGAMQVLVKYNPLIVMEMNEPVQQARSSSSHALISKLSELEYTPYVINDDGTLSPLIHNPIGVTNAAFVHLSQSGRIQHLMAG